MKRLFLFVLILTLIFIGSACKKNEEVEYNIIGPWNIKITFEGDQQGNYMTEFTPGGTWVMDLDEYSSIFGTYSVSGNIVQMIISYANFEQGVTGSFTGQFENENKISGDFEIFDDGPPGTIGTWIATRN